MHMHSESFVELVLFSPLYCIILHNYTYASIEADRSEIGEMNSKHLAWPALQVWVHESIPLTQ